MHVTSDLYKELYNGKHTVDLELEMPGVATFGMNQLISVSTARKVFAADTPAAGGACAGEISLEMLKPRVAIPRRQKMLFRIRLTDGVRYSEWIPKGTFYIDNRQTKGKGAGMERLVIQGYDAMLMAEDDYPETSLDWPAADVDVLREVAAKMGVEISEETLSLITEGYVVQYPAGYSQREVLGYIAAMYAGCFIINDDGHLHLIQINGIPEEIYYLVSEKGQPILIGGVPIRVR